MNYLPGEFLLIGEIIIFLIIGFHSGYSVIKNRDDNVGWFMLVGSIFFIFIVAEMLRQTFQKTGHSWLFIG